MIIKLICASLSDLSDVLRFKEDVEHPLHRFDCPAISEGCSLEKVDDEPVETVVAARDESI
jgi:hypothetical protein